MDVSTTAEREMMDVQRAVRHLLRRPLVLEGQEQDAELFPVLLRHRAKLTQWFQEQLGWHLRVDTVAGVIRLHKVPHHSDASRGARLAADKPPFDARRYQLLCLTLALLDESSGQTTLHRLADELKLLSSQEEGILAFEPDLSGERRAFVDVLRWLEDTGVLLLRDGGVDRYVVGSADPAHDALYSIHDRVLAQLLSAPRSPVIAKRPEGLLEEVYAQSEEGVRLRARHLAMRALVDDPVVYYEDLGEPEQRWLQQSLDMLGPQLHTYVGLALEHRREGVAAVDPRGELSDTRFPDGRSTAKHAALLLAEFFVRAHQKDGDGIVYDDTQVLAWTTLLLAEYGERAGWKMIYREGADGAQRLATEAMAVLQDFGLVLRHAEGWRPRPAIARFASGPVQGAVS